MKNFFLNILSSFIAFGLIIAFLIFMLFGMIATLSSDTVVNVSSNSFLHIKFSGNLPQFVPKSELDDLIDEERNLSLHDIIFGLKAAAEDNDIKGLVLDINFLSASYAKLEEVKSAIESFKEESGKPVYSYIERGGNKEYFLASSADSIFMQPEGSFTLTALQISIDFYKDALAKFGIEASFIPIGKYKSAPDSYTKTKLSAENRLQYTELLEQYQALLKNDLQEKRKLNDKELNAIYAQGWFSSPQALEAKLVDKALYWDELQTKLAGRPKSYKSVRLKSYRDAISMSGDRSNKIAIIYAEGGIMEGNDGQNLMMGTTIGSSRLVRNLRSAVKNRRVKGIILRIDSPGGSSLASDIIWREIQRARAEKPVFVSIGGAAASGGYYLAMASDKIFAQQSSIVGSIGVYMGKYNVNGLFSDWLKVRSDKILLDKENDLNFFDANRSFTKEERKILTANLTQFYNRFVQKAAEGRGMDFAKMEALAQGRVWTAAVGLEKGLVDEFGGLSDAILAMEKHLELSKAAGLTIYPRAIPLFDDVKGKSLLDSKLFNPHKIKAGLDELNKVQSWALWAENPQIN